MVWHNLNLITAQSCDFVFSSCPISAYKFQEIELIVCSYLSNVTINCSKIMEKKKIMMFYILAEKKQRDQITLIF